MRLQTEIMEYCFTDLRHALRRLARTPSFFIISVLCLGLGFGVNVAVFNVFYTVLVRPLPFSEAQELVWIWEVNPLQDDEKSRTRRARLRLWEEHSKSLEDAAVFQHWRFTLPAAGGAMSSVGAMVSTNYFKLLGLKLAGGRGFLDGEEKPGANKVVVLSHSLWQSRFGRDPDLLGKTITLYGADVPEWGYGSRFQVVGILTPEAKLRLMLEPLQSPWQSRISGSPFGVTGRDRLSVVSSQISPWHKPSRSWRR